MKKLCLFFLIFIFLFNQDFVYCAYLEITSPIGGENIISDDFFMIKWDYSDLQGDLEICIWDGNSGTFTLISQGVPITSKQFNWMVPKTYSGDRFRIKIASYSSTFNYDMSDTYFSAYPEEEETSTIATNQDDNIDDEIIIYPNPTKDYLIIEIKTSSYIEELEVFNLIGESIYKFKDLSKIQRIETSTLQSGLYYLQVRLTNDKIISKKIIISK